MDYLFSGGRGQRNLARDNPGNYCQRKVADSPDIADSVTRTANRFQYTHATIAGHKCRRFLFRVIIERTQVQFDVAQKW